MYKYNLSTEPVIKFSAEHAELYICNGDLQLSIETKECHKDLILTDCNVVLYRCDLGSEVYKVVGDGVMLLTEYLEMKEIYYE